MLKRGALFVLVLAFVVVFSFGSVYATSFSITDHSSTLKGIQISGADDLYAYEINFDYTGTNPSFSSQPHPIFNSTCSSGSYGSSTDSTNKIFTIYGSCLDSSQPGYDGSANVGNVTISASGTLSRRTATFIDNQGNEETVSYISTGSSGSSGTTSTGSSGGGGIVTPSATAILPAGVALEVIPDDLSFLLAEGTYNTREVTVRNIGNVETSISVFIDGEVADVLSVAEGSTFTLAPGEEKKVKFQIIAPQTGLITGKVYFLVGNAIASEVPTIVNIISENFLFDASLSLTKLIYGVRDSLVAQLDLLQVGPALKVDVVATYEIKDFDSGEPLYEKTETFYVDGSASRPITFDLSEIPGLKPGKYILGAVITYPGAYATSSSQFTVSGGVFGFEGFYVILFTFIVFAVITFVVVGWIIRSRRNVFYKRDYSSKNPSRKNKRR